MHRTILGIVNCQWNSVARCSYRYFSCLRLSATVPAARTPSDRRISTSGEYGRLTFIQSDGFGSKPCCRAATDGSITVNSTVLLNDGVVIPLFGLGVYRSEPGEETERAVTWALEYGYRHVDTAARYRSASTNCPWDHSKFFLPMFHPFIQQTIH